MRVVLDANVWVSAAIRTGPAHRIVLAWLAGSASFDVVMCPALIAEVEEVLTQRPRLRRRLLGHRSRCARALDDAA